MALRPIEAALGFSLALNVILLGGVGGAALTLWRLAPVRAAQAGRQPLRMAGDSLTPDRRRAFRAAIRQTNQGLVPVVQQARDARREAARLFIQPQFDRAAVIAALDRAKAADLEARTRLEGAIVDFAAPLSPQERASLAEGLRRSGPLRQPFVARRGAALRPASSDPSPSGLGRPITGGAP